VRATPYRAGGERLTSRTQYAHKTPTGVLDTQVTAEQAAEGFNRLASDLSEKLGLTAGDDAAFGRIFGGAKSPSSPVDKMPSAEYTTPESKPSGGKPMTAELPKLTGSDKQVEWAERVRAESLTPASKVPADNDILAVVAPAADKLPSQAGWWIDRRDSGVAPTLFAAHFGLTPEAAKDAYRAVWEKLNAIHGKRAMLATLGRPAKEPNRSFNDEDSDRLARAVGGWDAAERIAAAFGLALTPAGG
jgi:hypothetical protein